MRRSQPIALASENETLDFGEPKTWDVVARGVHSNATLDLLVLAATTTGTCWFDETRIGTSWRAVVPAEGLAAAPETP